ncbi:protein-L-isoaspartate O-methyltransferase [bacterium endosymbiont of Escarpia laminata]|nr:MAG: protein-L-isoaspartate O-methyltransferase [bacterium endosymbiont of Escarpia laminata]
MSDKRQMLREIEWDVQETRSMTGMTALDSRVMEAMKAVPRHEFVPPGARHQAYYNSPLPIGHGQTISQPYIVALMTDLLEPTAGDVMLEVGTGSGYQAAVLSRVVGQVYTLEIIGALSERAAESLRRLGYSNVECRVGDGYGGWAEQAPFDGIIVTAASPNIPQPLVDQLKPGGRLVIPIGMPFSHQELMVVEKEESGGISVRDVLGVAFVPLTRSSSKDE